jgi:hypothetical protein
VPLEGIVGWDTTTNGNLAQLLSEPTLMGAYEGAAVTVVGKGVNPGPGDYFGVANEATFPTGSLNLTTANCTTGPGHSNPYPSNFWCNPSSIDGLSLTDSSEGGGGIFVHAWAHNLQIANNRVFANIGTLSGGINVGQGESPDAYLNGTTLDTDPGSCESGLTDPINTQEPYCFDVNVNVHNNSVTSNTSIGDELFSGTPAGAGGVSFCTGADYYKFNYNWVCGNMSTGDGGGLSHIGFNKNGDIEHNTIIFNQSLNPTIPTNGGGIIVMATAPDGAPPNSPAGTECGSVTDVDCAPGLGDGTGPGLVINANLIVGNAADAGSGGGIRFQGVNGTDVPRFPNQPQYWYSVTVTNNIITNNVAGWDGGGVSLQDALAVNLVNNTIASNDSTATAGVLFNTIGAPLASAPGATNQTTSSTTSAPQPAGLVTTANSSNLIAAYPASPAIVCPTNNPGCAAFSNPYLANDVFWQNRTFFIGVGSLSSSYQQNIVTLYNSVFTGGVPQTTGTALLPQPAAEATTANGRGFTITGGTGACVSNSSYWDLGVRGDSGPGNHTSTYWLAPTYSALTNAAENGHGTHNLVATNPDFTSEYCNGSRVPPENGGTPFNVPPGISDATVPNPIFNLTPAATVDEGNNWINMTWGPLALTNPVTGSILGNYALAADSPAVDYIPTTAGTYSVTTWPTQQYDFFGNKRPDANVTTKIDIGAVEYQGTTLGPNITVQPANQTVAAGTTATFSVTATGTPTLTYAWQYLSVGGTTWKPLAAGTNLTSATMTTLATTAAYNGLQFRVIVTDGNGLTAISNPATLLVGPGITVQPANITVPVGSTATFSVIANGTATLTYAWQYLSVGGTTWKPLAAGTNLTSATMTTLATTVAYNGLQFRVIVTDGNGVSTTSAAAKLTISPVIAVQPVNQNVAVGSTATFSVTAVGVPTLTYAWQYLSVGGTTWKPLAAGTNLTSATMTTLATTAAYNGLQFRVVVTDGDALTVTSNPATLTVH